MEEGRSGVGKKGKSFFNLGIPAGCEAFQPKMKISVITDISVLRFYRYIGDISVDILEKKNIDKLKIDQNL